MIHALVEFYRAAIFVIFAIGCICAVVFLAFGLSTGSPFGFLMAVGILAVSALAVGTSAVLLSINDHLEVLRKKATAKTN